MGGLGGLGLSHLPYLAPWGCAGQWCKSVQGRDLSQALPKGAAAFVLLPATPVPWLAHWAWPLPPGTEPRPPPGTAGKPRGRDSAEGLLHPKPTCPWRLAQSLFLLRLKGQKMPLPCAAGGPAARDPNCAAGTEPWGGCFSPWGPRPPWQPRAGGAAAAPALHNPTGWCCPGHAPWGLQPPRSSRDPRLGNKPEPGVTLGYINLAAAGLSLSGTWAVQTGFLMGKPCQSGWASWDGGDLLPTCTVLGSTGVSCGEGERSHALGARKGIPPAIHCRGHRT